jgi:hypothetical protein
MMLSTVISTRAGGAGFDACGAAGLVWAEGEGIEKATKKAAARPILNRLIDV